MSGQNNINITINISNGENQVARSIPLEIDAKEAANQLVIEKTSATAENILSRLEMGHHKMLVGTAKVSKKMLKKILLEIAPAVTFRVINLGVKLLVLAGI
jgi:hypothetical protein